MECATCRIGNENRCNPVNQLICQMGGFSAYAPDAFSKDKGPEEPSCHETSSQKIHREFLGAVCDAHGMIRNRWTRDEIFQEVHKLVFDAQKALSHDPDIEQA